MKVGSNKNDLLERTLRFFDDKEKMNHYKNDHTVMNPYNTLMPSWSNKYYAYNGSLTEPACDKDVQWVVMKKPVDITFEQREAYRWLINKVPTKNMESTSEQPFGTASPWDKALGTNNRKIQDLAGRTVLEYPKPDFEPKLPEGKNLDFKPHGSELQAKMITKPFSLSLVGCGVAAMAGSVMFGYLLGSARRRHNVVQQADHELLEQAA